METKKSKYDTNPLDPDVERNAQDVWGDLGGVTPTYAPPVQQPYQPPRHNSFQAALNAPTTCRPVAGIGIAERWALLLAYVPYIGLIASIIELLLAPRQEIKVRFHASQAL